MLLFVFLIVFLIAFLSVFLSFLSVFLSLCFSFFFGSRVHPEAKRTQLAFKASLKNSPNL